MMKQKIDHNGYCLHCGKESKAPFCNRQCYRDYVKGLPGKEYEKQQRDSLSDRVVKRTIYIGGKGKIKYNQITPEMIIEKRAQILALRARIAAIPPKTTKHCKMCGKVLTNRRDMYCSDECRKIKKNKHSLELNKAKMMHKTTKVRLCKECNKPFVSEYGNKRSVYCCDGCSHTHMHRIRRQKERAILRKANIESVDAIKVFNRDGWKCQLCHKKLKRKDRGMCCDNAPELDHIIPLSKGGEHSYRNTQCACRKCNSEKSNNELGQLRLFG
jgi:5-methylcytosine-specific restriction endonuclease McrA/predicted nucleic acid-binding Zn ribbon protein